MMRYLIFIVLLLAQYSFLFGQLTRDTFYPGFDVGIESMEKARKEVRPGQGVVLLMKVSNFGASDSEPFIIKFWLSSDDELDENRIELGSKNVKTIKANTYIEFERLVVIPETYTGKYAYLFAEIVFENTFQKDPNPNDNIYMTGIKINEPISRSNWNNRFYVEMLDVTLQDKKSNKLNKHKSHGLTGSTIVSNLINAEDQMYLHIYYSKDKKADSKDQLISSLPLPVIINDALITFDGNFNIPDFVPSGKAYLYTKIARTNCKDLAPQHNQSRPFKVRIKSKPSIKSPITVELISTPDQP